MNGILVFTMLAALLIGGWRMAVSGFEADAVLSGFFRGAVGCFLMAVAILFAIYEVAA